ncbi:MAG TPA: cytochrome b N-terminal domain-containing protein [Nitrospinota bacterium]|nr:cytochrome b N-terminal domain-containing protein [Nitrospinota bacterium]
MENKNDKKFDIQETLAFLAFELPVKLYKSIIRHGYPDSDKNKSLLIFTNFFLHIFPVKVRKHAVKVRYSFCLGGITLLLFIILTITGVLLMFYYVPSTERAYQSMKDLEFTVSFGLLLRNMHRWGAHGMVIAVFLHMCRVFYTGSYKPPREFNWVIGVILLLVTLFLSFSGYLLPWDQLSFWAITVGTTIATYAPMGDLQKFVMLGGNTVDQGALIRFYVAHVFLLPLIATILIGLHFWRIRKDGGMSGPPL